MHLTNEAKVLIGIGVATVLIVLGGLYFLSTNPETAPQSSTTQVQTADPNILTRDDSNKISTPSAKLTIVEFSDFQCPACRAAQPTIKQALAKYPGQINFVYRHFPLAQHKNAEFAAQASEAAASQNQFWQYHDKLFETQDLWGEDNNPIEKFVQYAQELGLNTILFRADLESKKYQEKVRRDFNDGVSAKVNATPTFYFNNTKFQGSFSPQNFNAKIEELIKD